MANDKELEITVDYNELLQRAVASFRKDKNFHSTQYFR